MQGLPAVAGTAGALTGLGMVAGPKAAAQSPKRWHMPDEGEAHQRTWMAFGASEAIWGKKLLPEVRRNLVLLAQTIARYEPVSLLVRKSEMALVRQLLGTTSPANVAITLVEATLDDLWIRDTGPTFVLHKAGQKVVKKAAVDFNFNGWGDKQAHRQDAKVAALVARHAGVERLSTRLVMEGGCIEVDGQGTAIITESCVLNDNRNPQMPKAQFEALLMPLLGLDKIIWLPGSKGNDITDGHTDFYARFARPGVVVAGYDPDPASFDHAITKRHLALLKNATDAKGNKLDVIVLEGPQTVRKAFESKDFAGGYIGFYVCNGAAIGQEFGDSKTDAAARQALQKAFPGREVVQINMDGVAAGGGSIHCATQQELKSERIALSN
jgi:agmatine deiminase